MKNERFKMKRIIALLMLLPGAVHAGGWVSKSQEPISLAIVMMELVNKNEDTFYSTLSNYKVEEGLPTRIQQPANTVTGSIFRAHNPGADEYPYRYKITGDLIKIADGDTAELEYEITKTKEGEEPIVVQHRKQVRVKLLYNAMTHYKDEFTTPHQEPFQLRVQVLAGRGASSGVTIAKV